MSITPPPRPDFTVNVQTARSKHRQELIVHSHVVRAEDVGLPLRGQVSGDMIRALPPLLNHDAPITFAIIAGDPSVRSPCSISQMRYVPTPKAVVVSSAVTFCTSSTTNRTTHKRFKKKGYKDEVLNRTIAICRPCHSAVHRAHDVRTLAERFDTRDKLLEDEAISRFVAWAQKQRLTKKEDARNKLLRYRR